jgi:hypothetical protein
VKLVVLAQSALSAEPSKRALDDPPAREHGKAACGIRALDDLQVNPTTKGAAKTPHPIDERSGVRTVGPKLSKAKERRCQDTKEKFGTVPILDISRVDNHRQ